VNLLDSLVILDVVVTVSSAYLSEGGGSVGGFEAAEWARGGRACG
jgi:hypothetical protein